MYDKIIISGVVLSIFLLVPACEDNSQPEKMLAEDLQCPSGSEGQFESWGGFGADGGWLHSCKMKHGKFHVWKGDNLSIEGEYLYGKKVGVWIYRDKSGKIIKEETMSSEEN